MFAAPLGGQIFFTENRQIPIRIIFSHAFDCGSDLGILGGADLGRSPVVLFRKVADKFANRVSDFQ